MPRAFYIAALLVSLPVVPLTARADSESCSSALAEGQRSLQQKLLLPAQAAFSRCAQDDCPVAIRQECTRSSTTLETSKWLGAPLSTPGPNLAVTLTLDPGWQHARRIRRLQRATYGLLASGFAVGGLALAAGLRGHQIDNACASPESCSEASAAHGRMLYRSADAGAVIGGLCGISAAILIWHWLSDVPPESGHSTANAARSWKLSF